MLHDHTAWAIVRATTMCVGAHDNVIVVVGGSHFLKPWRIFHGTDGILFQNSLLFGGGGFSAPFLSFFTFQCFLHVVFVNSTSSFNFRGFHDVLGPTGLFEFGQTFLVNGKDFASYQRWCGGGRCGGGRCWFLGVYDVCGGGSSIAGGKFLRNGRFGWCSGHNGCSSGSGSSGGNECIGDSGGGGQWFGP